MTTLNIRYTEVAQQSIEDQIEYLAPYRGLSSAFERITDEIRVIEAKLLGAPSGYPVSSQARELGISQYRELNSNGYRVFYEIVEDDQAIVVALVLRDKQSVEKALLDYCLFYIS